MDNGAVTAIPAPGGFHERYVLLNDAPFFEVSGPLSAADGFGATRLRALHRARSRVLRVIYAVSVQGRSVEALANQVKRCLVFLRDPRECEAEFCQALGRSWSVVDRRGPSFHSLIFQLVHRSAHSVGISSADVTCSPLGLCTQPRQQFTTGITQGETQQ